MPRDSIEAEGKRRTHEEEKKGTPAMNKISRKGFLKIAAAAAMSGVTAGALAACNSASSSTAKGTSAKGASREAATRRASASSEKERREKVVIMSAG